MKPYKTRVIRSLNLSVALATGILALPEKSQPSAPVTTPAVAPSRSRYQPKRFSRRAELNYGLIWGVASLNGKWTESGEVIHLGYRVLNADKPKMLNDKKVEPALIDPRAGLVWSFPLSRKSGNYARAAPRLRAKPTGWPSPTRAGRLSMEITSCSDREIHADGLVVD